MQENLYPNLVSIILDGIKDDLEFRVRIDTEIDHNLMYSSNSVQPSEPLLESQYIWIISGISLVLLGIGTKANAGKMRNISYASLLMRISGINYQVLEDLFDLFSDFTTF